MKMTSELKKENVDELVGNNNADTKNLIVRLRRWTEIQRRFLKVYREMFAGFNWPYSKSMFEVLIYLFRIKKGAEPSVIADFLYMPRQTMTTLLDTMEKKEFIIRKPHPTDRRRKLVELSAKGKRTISKLLDEMRSTESQAMSAVSDERFNSMISVLDEVCDSIESISRTRNSGESN